MDTIRIDKFGRLLIPKPIRDRLGWEAGSEVILEEDANSVLLRAAEEVASIASKKGVLVYRGKAVGDLAEAVQTLRRRRHELVGGRGER